MPNIFVVNRPEEDDGIFVFIDGDDAQEFADAVRHAGPVEGPTEQPVFDHLAAKHLIAEAKAENPRPAEPQPHGGELGVGV